MTDKYEEDDILAPEAVDVGGVDIRNTTFVIPLDAPIPNELSEIPLPTGSLYNRIAAINEQGEYEFRFAPLAGAELLALDRAWRSLQRNPKVMVLKELPGARYDVMFTQAVRQIGLRAVDWPTVAEGISQRLRTLQRTRDSEPWKLERNNPQATKDRKPKGTNFSQLDRALPLPPTTESEDEDTQGL